MAANPAKRPGKKTRSQRAKQAARPIKKESAPAATTASSVSIGRPDLSSGIRLLTQTFKTLFIHRLLLGGVTAIYGIASLVLVTGGLGYGLDVAGLRDGAGNRVVGSIAAYSQLLTGSGGTQLAVIINFALILIGSLALVWMFRQVLAGKQPPIRDAYYQGMYPLVPVLLIVLLIGVQLIPMLAGTTIYQLLVTNGIAQNAEVIWWGVGSLLLSLISLYFLASSLVALYIATLPDVTPMVALRSARILLKGRRWTVLRKILFLPLMLLILSILIMLPVILLLPAIAEASLVILSILALPVIHGYMYHLYRELIRE